MEETNADSILCSQFDSLAVFVTESNMEDFCFQVIAGIFPVAQVREPYSVVAYLGRRLDLPSLLGLTPPRISPKKNNKETGEYIWSAMDICEGEVILC